MAVQHHFTSKTIYHNSTLHHQPLEFLSEGRSFHFWKANGLKLESHAATASTFSKSLSTKLWWSFTQFDVSYCTSWLNRVNKTLANMFMPSYTYTCMMFSCHLATLGRIKAPHSFCWSTYTHTHTKHPELYSVITLITNKNLQQLGKGVGETEIWRARGWCERVGGGGQT